VARHLDLAARDALIARMRFYRELGLTEFYRRPVDPAILERFESDSGRDEHAAPSERIGLGIAGSSNPDQAEVHPRAADAEVRRSASMQTAARSNFLGEDTMSARKAQFSSPLIAPEVPLAERAAALQIIREDIGECTRCALHKGRNKLVFGDGSPTARLMFVGEGPGADEDAQGIPFVGRAGQLLNNMIAAMGLTREEVYIANVVKCRPPGNRTPEPEEGATCSPFLFRQIDVVRPQVLVALGATAATYLLGSRQPLAGLRGRVHAVRGTQLIVTYHPAYLLRDPRQKKEAWADLQIAMRELGLKAPSKG
jgi:uracil-DNA glycosylase family 4